MLEVQIHFRKCIWILMENITIRRDVLLAKMLMVFRQILILAQLAQHILFDGAQIVIIQNLREYLLLVTFF